VGPVRLTIQSDFRFLNGSSSLPTFVGLSILLELRSSLLGSEFNECISLFTSIPDIDIEPCINRASKLCKVTPPSCFLKESESQVPGFPIPLKLRKLEMAPRITYEDAMYILPKSVVIDLRSEPE
jgi:hypothetical protein